MSPGLPNARREVHACDWIWHAIPIHEKLANWKVSDGLMQNIFITYPTATNSLLVCLFVCVIKGYRGEEQKKKSVRGRVHGGRYSRSLSLPGNRLLRKTTQYHSRSSSSGSSSSDQLNASS